MEHRKHLLEEHGSRSPVSPKRHSRETTSQRLLTVLFLCHIPFWESIFVLHVTRLLSLELELKQWRFYSPILLKIRHEVFLDHDHINPFDSRAVRLWCLPFWCKEFCDCTMYVILRVQKIRRRGTSLESIMTSRNFNEERSPSVGEAFACLWAEVWFSRLRQFPAKYTRCTDCSIRGSLWREQYLLLTRSTFRVVTYRQVLLCHDTYFHIADTSYRWWRPWASSYNTKASCVGVTCIRFNAHITHFNRTRGMQFGSTAESTSRVDFASSLTSRSDMTYLAYDKRFHLGIGNINQGTYITHPYLVSRPARTSDTGIRLPIVIRRHRRHGGTILWVWSARIG